ncbi:uncharacterized protein LOC129738171 [Uranotaenia lowii]|uniref:uncharacterized protein LOC129738171 n=1 Tax=Uranotaenia lowii TaxID=190385 RepID=UPI00247B1B49|nr:uncharacterized protein LOC129738171 [Uranotaenia lowii]
MTNPCYQLSKYICCILQASMESKYNTKDSFSFCREIRDTVIPHNHIMVSFDVISLFTNIPRDLVIRDIINRWDTIKPHTKINLDLFLEIVSFCMHASYFVFRGTHYIQKEGTAMGSPLSPILGDLVMDTLLDSVQKQLSYTIPTLRKYVDDLFLIVPADQLQHTLNVFNGYHHNIQFTCEEECEGKLPYLDMTVIRQPDNTIQTEWFIKPIASGRLLNFNSIHPLSQKIAIMQNFIDRVNKLSTIMDEDTKRTIITKHLLINDFPRHLINRCLNRTNWNNNLPITKPSQDTNNNNNITTYRSIPSIPLLSQQVIRLFKETYPTVKVTTRSTNTVNKLYTRIKDPVPFLDQHSVIYRVNCQCNWNYIGMTGSLLKNRLAKHRSNIKQLNQLIEQGYTTQDEKMQAMKTTSTALILY